MNRICSFGLSRIVIFFVAVCALSACAVNQTPHWQTVNESAVPQAVIAQSQRDANAAMKSQGSTPLMTSEGQLIDSPEVLAPGYVLRMDSPLDSVLSGEFTVDDSGTLKLPYGYRVEASGKSVKQLEQQAQSHYAPFYKSSPNIRLSVASRKLTVLVRGLVERPGQFPVRPDSGLDELIGAAGGLQKASDQNPLARFVRISGSQGTKIIRLSDYYAGTQFLLPEWKGGETIFFQRDAVTGADGGMNGAMSATNHVEILGQVRSPGEYSLAQGGDFFYYLTQAGGFTDRADLHNLMLVRSERQADGTQARKVFTFSIDQAREVPSFTEGDILLVHADNPSVTEKNTHIMGEIGQFLGSIATGVLLFVAL